MFDRRLATPIVKIKSDLDRQTLGEVGLPLGIEVGDPNAVLREGYESRFVTADGRHGDQIEFRVVVDQSRVFDLAQRFFVDLLPEEVFVTFEEFSHDAFRDVDAYASDEAVAKDRVLRAWENYGPFFCEDGRSGFGAVSYEPLVEVFIEEFSSIYIGCGLDGKERIEALLAELDLKEITDIPHIEGFEHGQREILDISPEELSMDDIDIKFSILETFGMQPSNRDEGEPPSVPVPYWIEYELDMSFDKKRAARVALSNFAVTADQWEEAIALAEAELLRRHPAALVARLIHIYRMRAEEIGEEIRPENDRQMEKKGVWYAGPIQDWY